MSWEDLLRPTQATGKWVTWAESLHELFVELPVYSKALLTADKIQAQREGTPFTATATVTRFRPNPPFQTLPHTVTRKSQPQDGFYADTLDAADKQQKIMILTSQEQWQEKDQHHITGLCGFSETCCKA